MGRQLERGGAIPPGLIDPEEAVEAISLWKGSLIPPDRAGYRGNAYLPMAVYFLLRLAVAPIVIMTPEVAAADGVAWFDFAAICDGPRSQADYIEIARSFHTVLVSDVPQFSVELENEARRFIALVDEFHHFSTGIFADALAE